VKLHPVFSLGLGGLDTPSLQGDPDEQPPQELHLAVFALPHLALEAEGAVGFSDLPRALASSGPATAHREAAPEIVEKARTVFAAMPFAAEYEDVYFVAMVDAARAVGAACRRLDREDYAGDVVQKLTTLIGECDLVIADISEANPNVMYEVGYAHALDRPSVHICSSPLDELPFDVRNWNTLAYSKGRTHALRDDLIRRLTAVLGEPG
jgi:nucleoside 2-deoxyribosyltransferase